MTTKATIMPATTTEKTLKPSVATLQPMARSPDSQPARDPGAAFFQRQNGMGIPMAITANRKFSKKPKSKLILLAITDQHERSLYASSLRDSGFVVQEVSNGLHCLQHLRLDNYSILVIEQQLPLGGGDGIIDTMVGDEEIETVPVILLDIPPVALVVDDDEDFIKPIPTHQVVQAVQQRLLSVSMLHKGKDID